MILSFANQDIKVLLSKLKIEFNKIQVFYMILICVKVNDNYLLIVIKTFYQHYLLSNLIDNQHLSRNYENAVDDDVVYIYNTLEI